LAVPAQHRHRYRPLGQAASFACRDHPPSPRRDNPDSNPEQHREDFNSPDLLPQVAAQQVRHARKRQKGARPTPATQVATPVVMPIRRSVVERSARAATALNKREPAVVRQGTGSWIRGR